MLVNLVQYRGTVGAFNNRNFRKKMVANKFYSFKCGFNAELAVLEPSSFHQIILLLLTIVMCMSKDNYVQSIKRLCISFITTRSIHSVLPLWFYSISITLSADVETNPGPKRNCTETFSFCHWNLNSISSHDYVKIFLLRAYITVHIFDIICLSEMYLDSSTRHDDGNLEIPGYDIGLADHPTNTKRGGVCIYYKNCLPLRILNIIFLNECINFELIIGDKTCNFVVLYRSPSQSQDVFENFCESFERTLDNLAQNNPFLLVAIGDFNAKSTNWCANDQTSFEGKKIEHITSQFGLSQIINEPTYILDSSSSCIDLIFNSQPNLVIESGVHPSLHQNCHHQIIYAKFNLQTFYHPP